MAHFNPAVTIDYLITKHLPKNLITCYLGTEKKGSLFVGNFVKFAIGTNINPGANVPNYNFLLPVIFGIEVFASSLLMIVILLVVYTRGLKGFSGIAIGAIIGLDIFFFGFISGASMNPARSLALALLSGSVGDLWLYWTTAFIGTSIAAISLRHKFE
jgi:aquaporin Z